MVAFVPPSGNDPPFLATWPMDYYDWLSNSRHSVNQLEVNLNRLCVTHCIFPALYVGYVGVSINL